VISRTPFAAAAGFLLLALMLIGCDRDGRNSGTVSAAAKIVETTITSTAVGPVELGTTKDEVVAALGKPDADDAGTLKYFARGMELFVTRNGVQRIFLHATTPDSERKGFNNYDGFRGTTDKGIRLGAQKADVAAAYGNPGQQQTLGREDNWYYPEQGMTFTFRPDGSLRVIGV
jgi:outer membrane protein assembly factor BamE (lipoprotein component of BamABCDE complex)